MSPLTPDEEREREFYHWIGRCVTEWANLEEVFFDICCVALATDHRRASIIFYKTPTFDSRLTLTHELVEACFAKPQSGQHPHPLLKAWNRLKLETTEISPFRNALAHHPVVRERQGGYRITESEAGVYRIVEVEMREFYCVKVSRSEALRERRLKVEQITESELPDLHMRICSARQQASKFHSDFRLAMQTARL